MCSTTWDGTRAETSPPILAICLIRLEEMKAYSGSVTMNSVSMPATAAGRRVDQEVGPDPAECGGARDLDLELEQSIPEPQSHAIADGYILPGTSR